MANGQANFTNIDTTTYGSFVPIYCDTGYEASGGSEAECLASGSWSTDVTCVVIGLFTLSIIISACFLFIKRQILICHTYEHSCEVVIQMVILWLHMAAALLNVKITCDCSLVCTLLRY